MGRTNTRGEDHESREAIQDLIKTRPGWIRRDGSELAHLIRRGGNFWLADVA
jgi:hypothetical protein